jgi:hypothetical protein
VRTLLLLPRRLLRAAARSLLQQQQQQQLRKQQQRQHLCRCQHSLLLAVGSCRVSLVTLTQNQTLRTSLGSHAGSQHQHQHRQQQQQQQGLLGSLMMTMMKS